MRARLLGLVHSRRVLGVAFSPCPSRHCCSSLQGSDRGSSAKACCDKTRLVEGVLGFEVARTAEFVKVLKGEAPLPPQRGRMSVEDSLKRTRPRAEPSNTRKASHETGKTGKVRRAFVAAFAEDGPVAEHHPRLYGIFKEAIELHAAVMTAPRTGNAVASTTTAAASAAALSGHIARELASVLPVDPSVSTEDELVAAVASHERLVQAALAVILHRICDTHNRVDSSSPTAFSSRLEAALSDLLQTLASDRKPTASRQHDMLWSSVVARHILACEEAAAAAVFSTLSGVDALSSRMRAVVAAEAKAILRACEGGGQGTSSASSSPRRDAFGPVLCLSATLHAARALLSAKGGHGSSSSPSPQRSRNESARQLLLLAHAVWMLSTVVAVLGEVTAEYPVKRAASVLSLVCDALVTCESIIVGEVFLPHRGKSLTVSHTHAITHRTMYSSLNISLDALRRRLSSRNATSTGTGSNALGLCEEHPEAAAQLVSVSMSLTRMARELADTSPLLHRSANEAGNEDVRNTLVRNLAVIARLGMSVETNLALTASAALRLEWCVPTKLTTVGELRRTPRSSTRREQYGEAHWRSMLDSCDALRLACAELVHSAFSQLVQEEVSSSSSPGGPVTRQSQKHRGPLSYQLLRSMQSSYFSLARRHYLCTQGLTRSSGGSDTGELHRALLESWLGVFVLLRTSAPLLLPVEGGGGGGGDGGTPHGGSRRDQRSTTCGTSLAQAMDVSFFLALHEHQQQQQSTTAAGGAPWSGAMSSAQITPTMVDEYIAEMFLSLGHNTSKQLWHLRTKGTLHFFTGQKRNKEELMSEEHVWRRHVTSTLATVSAHVMHPSLLWMPLWQLQEMVFLFQHHTRLFYCEERLSDGDASRPCGNEGQRRVDTLEEYSETAAASPTPPAFTRAKVDINGVRTDLARAHEYLVLRLYVVTNVLRSYRDLVGEASLTRLGGAKSRADASAAAGAAKFASALTELAKREPAQELAKRRGHRGWSKQIAEALLVDMPMLPAESEGVATGRRPSAAHSVPSRRAVLRVLNRGERTVSRALASHLFLNAIEDMKRRGKERQDDKGSEDEASGGGGSARRNAPGTLVLHLSRPSAEDSFGFLLDAATARLTRVVEGGSPFSRAVAMCSGHSHPSSPEELTGWHVVAVGGRAVGTGRDVAVELKGKLTVQLTLSSE